MNAAPLFSLATSLGLSLPAGLRAYLPLLALSIAGYFHAIIFHAGYQWLASPITIAVLAVLTLLEATADKIPLVDHFNDAVHTIIRPAAGAIVWAAPSDVLTTQGTGGEIVAALLGIGIAGTVHVTKSAVVRPTGNALTLGLAAPVLSVGEDVLALVATLLAILVPALSLVLSLILVALVIVALVRLARWRRNRTMTKGPRY